ncbi:DEKNAAC103399 [Brettanomyces naardenensis]|uniref:DEKNAAC103400 n=1 Tax=Brettanomyces naardenensis TaxID=13370 RepID=A0A448YNP8_BRENA|nr:DEKNAAC103399 [Brettanomyces naardenensis]
MKSTPEFLHQPIKIIGEKYRRIENEEHRRLVKSFDPTAVSSYSLRDGLASKDKNRYSDVIPYDFNRVKLDKGDQYINASYIQLGIGKDTGIANYIATQGPIFETASDFWRMCDQVCKKRIVIVMVTPLFEKNREKCYKYWNDTDFDVFDEEGDKLIQLKLIEKRYSDRGHFRVTRWETDRGKEVVHFYYDEWEDFSRPSSHEHILELIKEVNEARENEEGREEDPLIVHCSAGVGRTGTFITIDYFLSHCMEHREKWNEEGTDPVEDIVRNLRKQRMMMVQRPQQLQFVYDTIREYWEEPSKLR